MLFSCFIQGLSAHLGVLMPVCFVLAINLTLFVFIMVKFLKKKQVGATKQETTDHLKQVRVGCSIRLDDSVKLL